MKNTFYNGLDSLCNDMDAIGRTIDSGIIYDSALTPPKENAGKDNTMLYAGAALAALLLLK